MSFELTYQIVFQIFHFWNAFHFVNFTISAPINTNFWEHFEEVVCHINAWLMYDLNKKFAFRNMLVHIKKSRHMLQSFDYLVASVFLSSIRSFVITLFNLSLIYLNGYFMHEIKRWMHFETSIDCFKWNIWVLNLIKT